MEVTPAEFARMAVVTRASITQKLKSGTLIINSAGKLDTDNPINRAYIDKHQNKLKKQAASAAFFAKQKLDVENYAENQSQKIVDATSKLSAEQMQRMTLSDLVKTFGSMEGMDNYIKYLKDLTTIEEKNQRLQEKRLELLPRDFVIARLFGFQQQQASRILDVPESCADQVIALVMADNSDCRQKIIDYIRDLLSRAIGGAKDHVINELNSLRTKYDTKENSLEEKIDQLMEANR